MLAINWGVASVNGCLALSAATVYAVSPTAALFLILPAGMLIFAYRAYMSERRRHTELEFLHAATSALSRSPEIVPELEVLLERARSAFRVEVAELVLFPAEYGPSLRSTLGPGDRKRMLETHRRGRRGAPSGVRRGLHRCDPTDPGWTPTTCATGGPSAALRTA